MALHGSFVAYGSRRARIYKIIVVAILCALCFFVGLFQDFKGSLPEISLKAGNCPEKRVTWINTTTLDFAAHHGASDVSQPSDSDLVLPPCGEEYVEYTPCEDAKRSLKFQRERLIYRERHCPGKGEKLRCRIPPPAGYKSPFKWPQSRDLVWFANVPHKELAVEKKNQNWVKLTSGDRLIFPGGGTMFAGGADAYIDAIGKIINLTDGSIRTAIDTGCGVASWGAYLLSRNILTMSFAPRDTHEAQVQFALERGVPALIGILASIRLPYPSRAFDMAHCSRCLIPWTQNDGQYLHEVDRILRPGGYWILSGPPINWNRRWKGWNRTAEDLAAEQDGVEKVAERLCWKKVAEVGDIAVWRKPLNHLDCNAQFCDSRDPDAAWYTKLETCVTQLPEEVAPLTKWPEKIGAVPPRISGGSLAGISPEMFVADMEIWKKRVQRYKSFDGKLAQKGAYRNLLDMNAYLGGFAAALAGDPVWVMNVVPVEAEVNTLGAIYERGLIGTYQNWCEAMSTYPRTYDFIHADGILTMYHDRCETVDILLEMDRILRPEGSVIFRDDVDIILKAKDIAKKMEWDAMVVDHEDGPHQRVKILFAVKKYWTLETSR